MANTLSTGANRRTRIGLMIPDERRNAATSIQRGAERRAPSGHSEGSLGGAERAFLSPSDDATATSATSLPARLGRKAEFHISRLFFGDPVYLTVALQTFARV